MSVHRLNRRQRRKRKQVRFILILTVAIALILIFSVNFFWSTSSKVMVKIKAKSVTLPSSIEAGIEPYPLLNPISRESVIASTGKLIILGGLTLNGVSSNGVFSLAVNTGVLTYSGSLKIPFHDGAASQIGNSYTVFGGGATSSFSNVQSFPASSSSLQSSGSVIGTLPQPLSDLSVVQDQSRENTNTYLLGGYNGTTLNADVYSTTNGVSFLKVTTLIQPVRYGAAILFDNNILVFGGETSTNSSQISATNDIQEISLSDHTDKIIGHLSAPIYGGQVFLINGDIYFAGGQIPNGITSTSIVAFDPSNNKLYNAGLLPQAVAFGGYTVIGTGHQAVGYIIGGEVGSQSGNDQAGYQSRSLSSVISLKISGYGGPAGSVSSGSPFLGTLLIADRGNNRLIAINVSRQIIWTYPSSTMPPPVGGFYFPDDAFFIKHGTGIISNQEENHTIVEIGYKSGKILWQYGHPGTKGSSPGYLNQPDDAYLLKNRNITVADASNNRILFISPSGQVVSQIGNGVDAHVPGVSLAYPNGDTPLKNGDVLVSEINGSYIDEYTPAGHMVWSVKMNNVIYPSDPQQLGSNLYLMTDYNPSGEGRLIEFNQQGQTLWYYDVKSGDGALKMDSLAERLSNGLIITNDDYNDRIVVIDPSTNEIVWQFGLTGVSGTAPGLLSIPDGFDILNANGTTPTHPFTG